MGATLGYRSTGYQPSGKARMDATRQVAIYLAPRHTPFFLFVKPCTSGRE
jgi:hypothetical protein